MGAHQAVGADGLPWTSDSLSRAILGISIFLGVAALAAMPAFGSLVGFGETRPLAQLPWFLPVAQSFLVLSALAIAFLCAGRYLSLGGDWVLGTGAVFLASALLGSFYLLSWPGLIEGRGLITRLPNTASWLFYMTFSSLVPLIWMVRRPREAAVPSSSHVYLCYGTTVAVTLLLGSLSVVLEDLLPALATGLAFTPLNLAWGTILALLFALGAASAYRRYRTDRDLLRGYLALFLLLMAFGVGYSIMGGKRYDVWWYAARALYDLAYVAVLFGLLQEGYSLFGVERRRAEDRTRLMARLEESESRQKLLLALGDRIRELDDAEQITAATSELLGRHMKVGGVAFGEVDSTGEYATIWSNWTDGSVPSALGCHRIDDFGIGDLLRQGRIHRRPPGRRGSEALLTRDPRLHRGADVQGRPARRCRGRAQRRAAPLDRLGGRTRSRCIRPYLGRDRTGAVEERARTAARRGAATRGGVGGYLQGFLREPDGLRQGWHHHHA